MAGEARRRERRTALHDRDVQHLDAARYLRNARFVAELGVPVLDWLRPRPGERVLDLGCGDGALTAEIAAAGAAVVGVDSSPSMVEAARGRGLDARVMDGAALGFDLEFDAVFSNAALHWMRRPDPVVASVRRALKPGGRFVGEMGGEGNVASVVEALVAVLGRRGRDGRSLVPWYFPSPEEYSGRLAAHGFAVDRIASIPRPTRLPGEMVDWLDTFAGRFFAVVPHEERASVMAEVADRLRPQLADATGRWTVDYVRLRFAARLPE